MIKGIGIDIVELTRVEKLTKKEKFIDRILTAQEKKRYLGLPERRQVEFLAGRFSAKEAFAKARGTGIGKELSFLDIEIMSDGAGKPSIYTKDRTEKVHVSISHSREYAVSQVIIESSSC